MKLITAALYFATTLCSLHETQGELTASTDKGKESTNGKIGRKRELRGKAAIPKTKKVANAFGKIVTQDVFKESQEDLFNEVNWNRILAETSFPEPQCNFDLELECYLSNDPLVSITNECTVHFSFISASTHNSAVLPS